LIIAEFEVALEDLQLRLASPERCDEFGQAARVFVIKLDLAYRWLVMELVECFYHAIEGFALGKVFKIEEGTSHCLF
jgi:hypothetical protein